MYVVFFVPCKSTLVRKGCFPVNSASELTVLTVSALHMKDAVSVTGQANVLDASTSVLKETCQLRSLAYWSAYL